MSDIKPALIADTEADHGGIMRERLVADVARLLVQAIKSGLIGEASVAQIEMVGLPNARYVLVVPDEVHRAMGDVWGDY